MLIRISELTKHIAGRTLFEGVTLQIARGDRIGVVGPNGAGKSTLLRILAGDEPHDGGDFAVPRQVRLGMLRQEIDPTLAHSVREEAARALAHLDAQEALLRELEREMSECGAAGRDVPASLAERYDRASAAFELGGGFERESRVASVLAGLGFDEVARERPLHSFSGGWLMRVELAKLLLSDPDVLLLDEPTNHLDLPAIQWFEETLGAFRGAVVVVSHDRTFLRRHVGRVAELDGRGGFALYEGNYDRYLAQRAERRSQLLARKANQDREVAQTERFVERFRYKASKAKQVQSRIKALERMERVEVESEARRRIRLRIPAPPRSGDMVMTLADIHKRYGETRVYQGVDLQVRRGDRVALAGPNGAGKSTLLRIVAGAVDFDRGERTPGHNVSVAFYAQHQLESLDPGRSVLDELATRAHTDDIPRLRGHLGAFLFSGDDVEKRVAVLSGGEKARVALAKMLLHPANLLVLDEPTNHLDIEACEVLEDALAGFAGTLVFVSHDRAFINALASRIVEVRAGVLREFSGNYDDYLRELGAEAPPADEAAQQDGDSPARSGEAPGESHKERRHREREQRKARERIARRIERLEADIHEREAGMASLTTQLGDPEAYRDVDRMRAVEEQRGQLEAEIAALYREWEQLASEHENLAEAQAPE